MKPFVWRVSLREILCALLALCTSFVASAQTLNMADLQKNIDIFSGVLAEALDLDRASGLFGISMGSIDNTYLYGQGVVLEVRSPLARSRNTLGLASLNSTLQNMQARRNPFAALAQRERVQASAPPNLALNVASNAGEFYQSMMARIANVDYSLRFNTAIEQASEYARSLRSMGNLDDAAYAGLRQELDAMRSSMQTGFAKLRELEQSLSEAAANTADTVTQANFQDSLDAVLAELEPLRDQAVARAEELRQRSARAEQEYALNWQQQVRAFESNLYAAMCNYGSTLHALPEHEKVSVILTGLGDEADDNRRADKVLVFNKHDLVQCQSGSIDQAELEARSVQYSY